MMNVQNKVILVTGAGGGIGGELVAELLQRGAKVAAVDLRDEALQKLAGTLNNKNVSTHALNISDRQSVETLPQKVIEAHGAIDGIINCAGIIQPFVKVNDLDYESIERVMIVNFYGTLYIT